MFFVCFFLLCICVAESADVCPYEGGWALRVGASLCPVYAPVNCGKGFQLRCCPNGLVCAGESDFGGNYCCKLGQDCINQSSTSPKCPDPTWTLWGSNNTVESSRLQNGGWCCRPGDIGFYTGNVDGVACTAASVRELQTNSYFASTVPTSACVSSTSSAASTTSTTNNTSPTPTSNEVPESGNKSSTSLSGGAIAGIVVGVVCGVALMAGIFARLWWRKKKSKDNKKGGSSSVASHSTDHGTVTKPQQPPLPYVRQNKAFEMSEVHQPIELPIERLPPEIE